MKGGNGTSPSVSDMTPLLDLGNAYASSPVFSTDWVTIAS